MPSTPSILHQDPADDLLLLSGRDLEQLVEPAVALDALRHTYKQLADNRTDQGRSIGFPVKRGSIHVKAGLLPGSHSAFAAKVNVNLPDNWAVHRLPTIQGVVVLVDALNGRPLAIMESMTLTAIRTAATTALAATFGARKDSKVAAIIGCGMQARYQLDALKSSFPIEEVRLFDIDTALAQAFATANRKRGFRSTPTSSTGEAIDGADIVITCTTSKSAVVTSGMNLKGCFVAAMGADNPEKQEIDPALMSEARILVDDLDQCAAGGDLSHALRAGTMSRNSVHADLAELASGQKAGRDSREELVIFDSTGSGVQDVAVAWSAYQAARTTRIGGRFNLSGRARPDAPTLRSAITRLGRIFGWSRRKNMQRREAMEQDEFNNHLLADIGLHRQSGERAAERHVRLLMLRMPR
jgi:alanine dehydrogenase